MKYIYTGSKLKQLPVGQFGRPDHWNIESEEEHNEAEEAYFAAYAATPEYKVEGVGWEKGRVYNETEIELKLDKAFHKR